MNKTDLVNVVSVNCGCKKADAEKMINSALSAITDALKEGDKVQLVGFGTFEVKKTAPKSGRNPKTGEVIAIPAGKKPSFTASKMMKDAVN